MLSMSDAPMITNMASESGNEVERPNRIVAIPNTATAMYITAPTFARNGQREITNEHVRAPTAGAARMMPSPQDPTWKMSLAKIGSNAVAPAKMTANMSSDIAPSTSGLWRTKLMPANTVVKANGTRFGSVFLIGMHQIRTVEPTNKNAHIA